MTKPIEGDISRDTGNGFRRYRPIGIACALLALTACGTTGQPAANGASQVIASVEASLPTIFKNGCAGVSIADGAFKAAAPALVASGKLNGEGVAQEASIFAVAQATCANPPTDLASAATTLLGQAAAIYLLMAPPTKA